MPMQMGASGLMSASARESRRRFALFMYDCALHVWLLHVWLFSRMVVRCTLLTLFVIPRAGAPTSPAGLFS